MKKYLVLFVILLLSHKIISQADDCSGFLNQIESDCRSFLGGTKTCNYYNNQCIEWYNRCTSYNPNNNFDDKICESLTASDINHKCVAKTESNKRVCKEELKECNDLGDDCLSPSYDLNLGGNKRCVLNGKCELHYNSCEDDDIKLDQTKCIKNIPSSPNKKCKWDGSSCREVYKECNDLSEEQCKSNIDLDLGDNKRCVFFNKQCNLHYKSCEDNDIKSDKGKCLDNIPSTNTKKCIWDSSTSACTDDDRKCNDFIVYAAYNEISSPCYLLSHDDDDAVCFIDGVNCIETFPECLYKGQDKKICEDIKPLKKPDGSSDEAYTVDPLNKCEMKSSCTKTLRTCDDYNKREDDTELLCPQLKSEKDPDKTIADCVFEGNRCIDMYLACELYNGAVSNKDDRNENECKSILARIEVGGTKVLDPHYKCSFKKDDNNRCITEKKECEEITNSVICNSHSLNDNNDDITCIFQDTCKKKFKNCDVYNDYYKNDQAKITRNDCESINPIYTGQTKLYKCVYKEEAGTKTCEKEEITKCEDYKGQNEGYCISIPTNDTDLFICKFINKECVTQYINCEAYNSQIGIDGLVIDKNTCESIVLGNELKKCMYKEDKYCETEDKLCSEYLGEDNNKCSRYQTLDTRTSCVIENKKCVEKFIPKTISEEYKYCSDYRGTDKDFCKSIQPYYNDGSSSIPDLSSKCEFENNECVRVSKKCEEGKDETECSQIKATDEDKKRCVFTNNKCIEQYKTCALYNAIDGTINKDVCESIVIENDYLTKKCVFTAGTGGAKNTCTQDDRVCTDFQVEFYSYQCSGISLTDQTKKCVFYNNACSKVDKTCFDMAILAGADDEKCGKGSISSSNKICVAKEDGSGCQEIDKPKEQNTETETKAEESYGGKKYLSKLVFILLCLFV